MKHTPMPVINAFEPNSPYTYEPVVQLMARNHGYQFEHSMTEVAVPMVIRRT
jgi:hypothetical protein